MADVLRDALLGHVSGGADGANNGSAGVEPGQDAASSSSPHSSSSLEYLISLAGLPLSALESSEPQRLAAQSHTLLVSIQEFSKRSHTALVQSAASHAALARALPAIASRADDLKNAVPLLEHDTSAFQAFADRSRATAAASSTSAALGERGGGALESRKRALLLLRNADRAVNIMELPVLLSSALLATPPNFSSALDIYAHTRRLQSLYPSSALVAGISRQADVTIRHMASVLLLSLKAPSLKLAASLRLVGWLRRILPDLEPALADQHQSAMEPVLAAVFLVSRLETLAKMLDALEPLQNLADRERDQLHGQRGRNNSSSSPPAPLPSQWSSAQPRHSWQHTERYLKRYIEIFREHSFGILSMYRGVFSDAASTRAANGPISNDDTDPRTSPSDTNSLRFPPPALATLPLQLYDMLYETLHRFVPVLQGQSSYEAIYTQVLYCAGSLGRLGCDFSMLLADMASSDDSDVGMAEWVNAIKRHRLLAGRLESVMGSIPAL